MIKIGMMLGDRYEILEKIGTGGMSDVYKAKDHKLNRFVAVKVLKQEFSENTNFVSKFRVEAQAAASLMHPNIVNVYDVGEENGVHYIVMELVEGITLKKYIEKKARLSVKEAVSIAIQACMGLEAAHNNHIIHRDIKPQNIIISKEGKVKVTDFGIAKAATSNTITSNVMGSVHYTSPEQARGGYSDERSDIYSMGITLFEMLTGRVPFNGDTTVAIAIKQIQGGENRFFILVRRLESRCQRSGLQKLLHPLQKIRFLCQRLIHSRLLAHLGDPSFQDLDIGKNQFQIDRLDVPERIDAAVHMHHIGVLKAAHHVNDGVHLTDVAQELVAESFSLRCSLNQTGDVHELDHSGRHLFGVVHISEKLQPLVRNGYDSHIGIDGAERIICGFRSRFGQ